MEESTNSVVANLSTTQGIDIVSTSDALLTQLQKDPWIREDDAIEMAKEASVGVMEVVYRNIPRGVAEFKTKDFYLELLIRQNPQLPATQWEPKVNLTPFCPTPTHDASVWLIHNGEPQFLWMVPSVEYGLEMLADPLAVKDKELFKDLLDFMDGSLRRRAKQMNGEPI